jgi:peptidase E
VPATRPRILAIGGHEFDRRSGNGALCDLVVELAGVTRPSICLLPTASGDPEEQIIRFRRAFGERDCDPSAITLFRLGEGPLDLRDELLSMDAIYVGGGSMVNLLAIWRAHGIGAILEECWSAGVLLCGQSAGAMCWFEHGLTSGSGTPRPAAGLGFLPGSACVHYGAEPLRRRAFREAVAGGLPAGLGLEDQTAVLFEGREVSEAVSARDGAKAWSVSEEGGSAVEDPLRVRRLEDRAPPIDGARADVIELRRTLATRATVRRARRGRLGRLD